MSRSPSRYPRYPQGGGHVLRFARLGFGDSFDPASGAGNFGKPDRPAKLVSVRTGVPPRRSERTKRRDRSPNGHEADAFGQARQDRRIRRRTRMSKQTRSSDRVWRRRDFDRSPSRRPLSPVAGRSEGRRDRTCGERTFGKASRVGRWKVGLQRCEATRPFGPDRKRRRRELAPGGPSRPPSPGLSAARKGAAYRPATENATPGAPRPRLACRRKR